MADIDLGKVVGPIGPKGDKGDKGDPGLVENINSSPNPTNTVMQGKKVYCKDFWIGNLKARGTSEIALDLPDFDYVWVDMMNSTIYSQWSFYPACYNDGSSYVGCYIDKANKKIKIVTSGDWSGFSAYIVIRYYKN